MQYKSLDLDSISLQFKLPPSKILITGGLGFIFSHVAEWFAARGHEVHVMDNCSDGSNPRLIGKFIDDGMIIQKCNINDIFEYLSVYNKTDDFNYDYVIHAAAESNVDKSIDDCMPFYESNIHGTITVLNWCRQLQERFNCIKQILYINTDEVYGNVEHAADITAPLMPSSPYAASKASAGCIANSYRVTYGLPIKEFRMCNIIGKRQADTKLIPKAIKYMREGMDFPVYGNGSARREYMDVRLIGLIIEHFWMLDKNKPDVEFNFTGKKSSADEYIHNITMRESRSIADVLKAINGMFGKTVSVTEGKRPGHDHRYAMIPADWLHVLPKIFFLDTLRWIASVSDNDV